MLKKSLILLLIIFVIGTLFITGIVPQIMGKQIALRYVQERYSDLNLQFERIDFVTPMGAYYVQFKGNNNQFYNFKLNSKYFPTRVEYDSYLNSNV